MIQIVRYPEEAKEYVKETEHVRKCPLCGRKTSDFGYTHEGYDIEKISFFETLYIKWVFLECDKCGCSWKYDKCSETRDIRYPMLRMIHEIKKFFGLK